MPEEPKGNAPDFVYVIFIAAHIDTVWNGLLDREVTARYWGHYNESDWKTGSEWRHVRSDGSQHADTHGVVREIDPPNKLVVTWNAPLETYGEPAPSQVTYELVELGPDTRLTVTHSKLDEGSKMHQGVTQGWPAVLSNLKTLLETGKVLSEDQWSQGDSKPAE